MKFDFHRLFKWAIENITIPENNIMARFRTCGIFLVGSDVVLNRLYRRSGGKPEALGTNIARISTWKQTGYNTTLENREAKVVPGKGINIQDLEQTVLCQILLAKI